MAATSAALTETGGLDGQTRPPADAAGGRIDRRLFAFYAIVVAIQGVHVFEHIVQLVQVFVLGVPDKDALGLLGYVFRIQGTEEWLHLVFNVAYVISLITIAWGFFRSPAARAIVPAWALAVFLLFGVGLELWHVNEHIVIISNVIANNGCPCPGILDERLNVSDTVLHFFYNVIAYAGTLPPFVFLLRHGRRRDADPPTGRRRELPLTRLNRARNGPPSARSGGERDSHRAIDRVGIGVDGQISPEARPPGSSGTR